MSHPPVPPVLVIQHEDGTGPGLVGAELTLLGLDLDIHHPWAGQPLPATLDGWSGLLVLGGAPNCEDDVTAPWLPAVRLLMHQAVADSLPLLGICLGGQILAHTFGGTVRRRPRSPELGAVPLHRLPATADDPVLGTVPENAPAAQWHWDEITRLPEGAVPLLTGDDCTHQGFRIGRCAWGLQFHPEVLADEVARWALSDGPSAQAAGADPVAAVASLQKAEPQLRSIWGGVARAWGRVVVAHQLAGLTAPSPSPSPSPGGSWWPPSPTSAHATAVTDQGACAQFGRGTA